MRAERARHAALEARLRRDTPARLLVATRRLLAGRSGAYELAVRILAAHPDDGQVDGVWTARARGRCADAFP